MATFVVYKRLSEAELRAAAETLIPQLEGWFENNPKRRVCTAELWYGGSYKIKRKDVRGQIQLIVEKLIKEKS